MSPTFPERIGDYVPERLLGRGAMAAVYLCRTPSGAAVAVKWLDQPHPPLVRRFSAEIRALERLEHPGVVRFIHHGVWEGRPFLVMEYIDGSDLRGYAQKLHQRPPAERYSRCRTIGQSLAEALACLHDHGLIHRDVKPSNVLIDSAGRAVLADLGVVKDTAEVELTSVGQVIGSLAFAAPEQLRGERVDPRSDLFGLGATLYYLLTLRRPFEGRPRSSEDTEAPELPSAYDPNLPAELEGVIMRLLSADPRRRYADAREVARALSEGGPAGMPLAGRQQILERVRACLDRVARGETLVVRPTGVPGTSRGWLVDTLLHGARRRGLAVWCLEDGPEALQQARGGLLGVLQPDQVPPPGLPVVEIALAPLGLADVRRSLVAAAPLTPDAAAVAERLHRLTGGLSALLIPLLSQYADGNRFALPDDLPEPPAVADFLEGLDIDELDALAALAALGHPADVQTIEALCMVPAEEALARPAVRGVVRIDPSGRWRFSAALFAAAALARSPDPEGLLERAAELSPAPADTPDDDADVLAQIDAASASGALAAALEQSRLAVELATGSGDRARECRALCARGLVLLDVGLTGEAGRVLADATALAKAGSLEAERRISHALRARASLETRPGRHAAAAAVDRIMPHLSGGAAEPLLLGVWARAAGMLGDERAFDRAVDRAEEVTASGMSGLERRRVSLAVAQGAAALGRQAEALARLAVLEADAAAAGEALLRWEAGRLRAALEGSEPPPTSPLAYGLTPEQLAALKRRAIYISGRVQGEVT